MNALIIFFVAILSLVYTVNGRPDLGRSITDEEVGIQFDTLQADSNCTCYFNWRQFWKGCQVESDECSADAPSCLCTPYHQGSFCAGFCSDESEEQTQLLSQEQ
eukprot:TRINITY_DN828_c0_g2_i1.p2 TRINITY_DN828_c0_g2~~TRINITY_DN828_c0_g2_i1.p2  ORF type:complete len:104 (-),score=11.11 TRINITY_DN828_c0_g2_i1:28-339(-)